MTSSDSRERNIERILRDGTRLRQGLSRFSELLDDGGLPLPVTAVAVDLDGSAVVRKAGIEAKVELVHAARHRMLRVVPADAVVVDSGTRDETYVLLPDHGTRDGGAVAEHMRAVIEERPFSITGIDGPVAITASAGYVASDGSLAPRALIAAAQDAQFQAKRERNAVREWQGATTAMVLALPAAADAFVRTAGLGWDDVAATGLDALEEKLGGLWHWCVAQAGTDGQPTHWPHIDTTGLPHAEIVYFRRMHESAAFEARVASTFGPGRGYRVEIGPRPAEHAVHTAEYLPGQWVSAIDAPTKTSEPVIARVAAARWEAAGITAPHDVEVELPWSPSRAGRLLKLQDRHGLSIRNLVVEAAALAVDKAVVNP